ncbi:MAG: hypothetical protein J7K75_06425 [Desulfuromonas sp.]|nr:hypothetical protein [Desulfuromonas sp.]
MNIINANRSILFLQQQPTLPVPPNGEIVTNKPILVVPKFSLIDTNRMAGGMNTKDSTVDTCKSEAAFLVSVDMEETGAPLTTPPKYAEQLKVSGFKEAASPAANTYELVNDTGEIGRGSALTYMDGKQYQFTNTLVGDTEIVLEVGKIGVVNTKLSGYIDNVVAADVPNPTAAGSVNPMFIVGCADIITLKGVVIPAEKIIFKTNPEIANLYTMGGASGHKSNTIVDYGLTCEITFPVESATFGREAAMIQAGDIEAIKVIIGADDQGVPIDGKSVVFIADTTKAVTYSDTVNNDLLQRVLTLRLYDSANPALRIVTGTTSGL